VLEGPDGDVVEVKVRKRVEPVLQAPVGEVDGCPVVVFGAGVLDVGVEVVAGGVEGVQDGVPAFVRLSVVGAGVSLAEGGDDGAEELPAIPVADRAGVVVGFVDDGDDLGYCHALESSHRVRQPLERK
jgi:hypothetical protein